jgi:site-specific recombinase XerD
MLRIITPTRELDNWNIYGTRMTKRRHTDTDADKLVASLSARYGDFTEKKLIGEPYGCVVAEKPKLQKILENSSEDEKNVYEKYNDVLDGAEAVKLSKIDLNRELEIWLGNLTSENTVKIYRRRATKFLKWCDAGGIIPFMIEGKQAREFQNWLKATGASNSVIRSTISACRSLFDRVLESHNLARRNVFKIKDLLPPNKREHALFVPNQAEIDRILGFTKKNPEVYTAIKLMRKHGLRIGAFEKMRVAGNKAVTITKGKEMSYIFDDEDVSLWRTCPLNGFTAKKLGERVNYAFKKAFHKGVVRHRYSAHKLRHFFALDKKKSGSDIYEISKALGHRHLSTTAIYLDALDKESLSGEEI